MLLRISRSTQHPLALLLTGPVLTGNQIFSITMSRQGLKVRDVVFQQAGNPLMVLLVIAQPKPLAVWMALTGARTSSGAIQQTSEAMKDHGLRKRIPLHRTQRRRLLMLMWHRR